MNESLFLLQTVFVLGFGLGASRLGKGALFSWICLQAILANLFVLKQISFLGFTITCSDAFAVGGLLGLNLMREFYGEKAAKQTLHASFFCMAFFVVMAQIHLLYLPSPHHDTAHSSYNTLLAPSARLLGASIISFLVVQRIDLFLFGALQRFSWPLAVRSTVALASCQLLDTLLFSFLGLFGLLSPLGDIILISFCVKLLVVAISGGLLTWARKWGLREV